MTEAKNSLSERIRQMTPLQRAVFALQETKSRLDALEKRQSEAIAIVGMACRFPGAESPEAFHRLLREGICSIQEVPAERWDVDAFYSPDTSADGKMNTRWGGFLENIDLFDNHFFGISAREARHLDPQHRIVLELAWEALEDAGLPPSKLRHSPTGVFLGLSHSEYGITLSSDLEQTDAFVSTGTAHCIAANRISYLFDFHGPSLALDTACSSSLVALHLACQSIRNGEATMALAGGVNLILSPLATINLTKAGFSAPDGQIRAFDARAKGYVRGEGAGMVVLKPLSAALTDKDRIYAVIRGSAVNQNGCSNGLTAPNRQAQETALRRAYEQAKVAPGEVQYVEAQGTGTALGDAIEAMALGSVMKQGREPNSRCGIGSVKTNIGHLEAASGMASLIKVAMAMQHRELPPSLNFQTPNPDIDFERMPLEVLDKLQAWPTSEQPRIAGVSAFGFGGSNAHVVLQEAPNQICPEGDFSKKGPSAGAGGGWLPISARTEAALQDLTQKYIEFLRGGSSDWQDICFTAATRRDHHDCRLVVSANSNDQAADLLQSHLENRNPAEVWTGRKPFGREAKVAFVFGNPLDDDSNSLQRLFSEIPNFAAANKDLSAVHQQTFGTPLASDGEQPTGPVLASRIVFQLCIANWWRYVGVNPAIVFGNAGGELSAACMAGMLTNQEALRIVSSSLAEWRDTPVITYNEGRLPCFVGDGHRLTLAELTLGFWQRCLGAASEVKSPSPTNAVGQADALLGMDAESLLASFQQQAPPSKESRSLASTTIGQLYTAGVDLNWKRIAPPEGSCIRLPSYPWHRERHWVDNKEWLSPAKNQVDLERTAKNEFQKAADPAVSRKRTGKAEQTGGKRLLPRPNLNTPFAAPRTQIEKIIAEAWSSMLEIDAIGIHDDFFELGGDSLQAASLLNYLQMRDDQPLNVTMRSMFQARTIAALAEFIESNDKHTLADKREIIRPISRGGDLPLSLNQEALWFLDRLEPDRPTYLLHLALNIRGPLDIQALEYALDEIQRRHESLRTTFPEQNGQPVQVIAPPEPRKLPLVDFSRLPDSERESALRRRISDEMRRPLNLEHGPLSRVTLLQRGEDDFALVASTHHIIHDGWSMGILLSELAMFYQAFQDGRTPDLPELPIQYVDFAAWQRSYLKGETLEELKSYWRTQLENVPPLELPTDFPRPAVRTTRGSSRPCVLSPQLSKAVREFSRRTGVTPFMTLLAAFQALLSRYSGQTDFAIGAPVANRHRPETEGLVGYFVNVTVLRSDLSGEPSFNQLLDRVKQTSLEAFQRHELTLDQIVDAVKPPRDLSRNPLFQVMFALQNIHLPPAPELGIEVTPFEDSPVPPTANFDLTLELFDNEDGFQGILNFSTDLFEPDTIDAMVRQFQTLVEAAVGNPDEPINLLPLLTAAEQGSASVAWNQSEFEYDSSRLVQHLFEEQAARKPNAVAVTHNASRLSYEELNRRANRLAHHLISRNITVGSVVGIHLTRSTDLIVCVLGVLKSGAAYVPLDPDHAGNAPERNRTILTEAGVSAVITSSRLKAAVSAAQQQVLVIDDISSNEFSDANPELAISAEQLAYILYTSGSTGQPKGVRVTHGNLLNAYQGWLKAYRLDTETSAHLQMASFGFDVFAGDLVRALCSGGKLVLCPSELLLSPDRMLELMCQENIDAAEFVPHVLRNLLDRLEETGEKLDFMSLLVVGSDSWFAADHRRAQRIIGPRTRLINSYGLTEATIDSCFFEGDVAALSDYAVVPIGRPFANVRLYILDERLNLTPPRVPGELYIGGHGVAAGYVNSELDTERFVDDPFSSQKMARLCRTGDRARRRSDGQVEFLGRADKQVKIRGYRIEPGEVEVALRRHPSISQAAVVARQNAAGDLQLIGYLVADEHSSPTIGELRSFLKQYVPAYMIPTAFVTLPELPMTSSGKLDQDALPEPKLDRTAMHGQYLAPRTETERQLASIWADLLELEKIGVHDDFFDLGGHSLLALRMVTAIRDTLSVECQLHHLFSAPTVAALGQVVEAIKTGNGVELSLPATSTDWDAELILDPTIRVDDQIQLAASNPENALLTGATGFLGAFLLDQLLKQTELRIYCLVRARNIDQARDKLRRNLEQYRLGESASSPRVVPICGDLSQPRLGLAADDYQHLAETVDVIYHNGARVSSIYPYPVLKPANVVGTVEALRLATTHKAKQLHFVSTLSVLETPDYATQDEVDESQELSAVDSLNSGYAQSKFVAEKLVGIAAARGLPTSIHRPGRIAGDSATGASNLSDLTHLLIKLCIEIRKVPDVDGPVGMAPVDYVARAIVGLTLDKSCFGKVFHLQNPEPVYLRDVFAAVRALGYNVETVELHEWLLHAAEQSAHSEDETIAALASLAGGATANPESEEEDSPHLDGPRIGCTQTLDALKRKAIRCPSVDDNMLLRYLRFFVEQGFIEPPDHPANSLATSQRRLEP